MKNGSFERWFLNRQLSVGFKPDILSRTNSLILFNLTIAIRGSENRHSADGETFINAKINHRLKAYATQNTRIAGDPSRWNASTLLASFNVAQGASRLFLLLVKSQTGMFTRTPEAYKPQAAPKATRACATS
ncbi:MAG: hypothetical protein WCP55_11710 [Lentisphaerota bacterium]